MDQTSYILKDSENQTFKLFVIGYLLGVGKSPYSCSSVTFYFCYSKVELIILIKKKSHYSLSKIFPLVIDFS